MESWLVIGWLTVFLVLLVAGLPLAAFLCPRLSDRGASIALPLSLAVIGLCVFWFGQVSFGWLAYASGFLVLVILTGLARYSDRSIAIELRPVIETVIVFTLAFGFLIAIRAVDPAIHPGAGEKFLDYGLLRTLLRSPSLPPEDFWFAGESVRYYYTGHMLSAMLTELTFTLPRFAYNLALAGFYAMLVTAVYGMAGSLADSIGTNRVTAGAFGAFFVGFASNLETALRGLKWLLESLHPGLSAVFGLSGVGQIPNPFDYWDASRVIRDPLKGAAPYDIPTEFPLFSWLNGDLHAHMMSTPFLLLMVTLCFSYYRTPAAERNRRRLLLGIVAVLGGLIASINTWSFPTVFGLLWLTLVFSPTDLSSLLPEPVRNSDPESNGPIGNELRRLLGAFAIVGAFSLISILSVLPFFLTAVSGRTLALVPHRSSLLELFTVTGGFLLVFVPIVFGQARRSLDQRTFRNALLLVLAVGLLALWLQQAAMFLMGPLVLVSWLLVRLKAVRESETDMMGSVGFQFVLLLAGAVLALLVEFFYLKEKAGPGRFNTVFKTHMQIWVLWSPAAGCMVSSLVRAHSPVGLGDRLLSSRWFDARRFLPTGGQLFVLLIVLSTSMYGSLALTTHFTSEHGYSHLKDPTLDGTAYVSEHHPYEATAIQWLDNRSGQPVIAAAPGVQIYQWANPVSSLTGLPTIAGWTHEIGYRNQSVYNSRVSDVETLFEGPTDRTVRMLKKYDVRYIYVGPTERQRYNRESFAFDRIDGVTKRHVSGSVVIYEVNQTAL